MKLRAQIERALIAAFGSNVDTSGDKAIDVAGVTPQPRRRRGPLHPDAPLRRAPRIPRRARPFPKIGGEIDNYPDQNLENGRAKNKATGDRYKDMVRAIKRLEAEMVEDGTLAREYPGYMVK